jgi:hypothetical protein
MKQFRILKQQINQRQFLNIPFITNLLNQQQQLSTSIFIKYIFIGSIKLIDHMLTKVLSD